MSAANRMFVFFAFILLLMIFKINTFKIFPNLCNQRLRPINAILPTEVEQGLVAFDSLTSSVGKLGYFIPLAIIIGRQDKSFLYQLKATNELLSKDIKVRNKQFK